MEASGLLHAPAALSPKPLLTIGRIELNMNKFLQEYFSRFPGMYHHVEGAFLHALDIPFHKGTRQGDCPMAANIGQGHY
jgi:hypothetical protein